MNEEIIRLRKEIKLVLETQKEIKENKDLSDMTKKLFDQLDEFKKKVISEQSLLNLMKIQNFIKFANE